MKYKKITGNISKNGDTDPQSATGGSLTIGQTYTINTYNSGDDFTNVGAPSNATGVKFIATGDTPADWTNSSQLDYDNGNLNFTINQNSLGNIWVELISNGTYNIKSSGLFGADMKKIEVLISSGYTSSDAVPVSVVSRLVGGDDSTIPIYLLKPNGAAPADDFEQTSIEIRIYP